MHELSVTQSLLDIALHHAEGKRVVDLYLVIGQLSSFVDDSVQFYWDIITEGTLAEGSHLHFRRIPAEFLCCDCGQHYTLDQNDFACPTCGSAAVKVIAGEEFYLEAIDVETRPIQGEQHEPTYSSR